MAPFAMKRCLRLLGSERPLVARLGTEKRRAGTAHEEAIGMTVRPAFAQHLCAQPRRSAVKEAASVLRGAREARSVSR